jgi:hypothetical protein
MSRSTERTAHYPNSDAEFGAFFANLLDYVSEKVSKPPVT